MIISNLNDTICAISTPAGTGGIAVAVSYTHLTLPTKRT